MYYATEGESEDRLERLRASWPRVLEPVALGEQTTPVLAGAASPTLTRVVNGERSVFSSRALALLRLPADAPVTGRPSRYLGAIMMVGEASPAAFSSHISSLVPKELEALEPDRHLGAHVERDGATMVHRVALRRDAGGWLTGPLEVAMMSSGAKRFTVKGDAGWAESYDAIATAGTQWFKRPHGTQPGLSFVVEMYSL